VAGDLAQEKTIRFEVVEKTPVRILNVKCSRPIFEWTLSTIQDGFKYEIRVKPKMMSRPETSMFLLETDSKIPRQKNQSFYAVIEPERPFPK
jgi:hypothetical protein